MKRLLSAIVLMTMWLSVSAQCPPTSPLSVPYTESFDTQTAGAATSGSFGNCYVSTTTSNPRWEYETSGTANSSSTGPLNDNSGTGLYAYLETSGGSQGDTAGLILPEMDLGTLSNPELSFYYHMYGAAMGSLTVQINNGNGWVSLWSLAGQQQTAETDPWTQVSIALCNYAGDTVRIKFLGERGGSFTSDVSIDDIAVNTATSSCAAPNAFMASNVSTTSADFSWSSCATGATTKLIYGAAGFNPGSAGTSVTVTAGTHTLSSLSSATAYEAYILNDCGAGVTSDTVGPLAFTTTCTPYTATYTRDFDSDNDQAPALCWAEYATATNTFAQVITPSSFNGTQPFSGAKFLEMNVGFVGATDTLMAISPEFSDMSGNNRQIKFQVATSNTANTLYVGTMSSQSPSATITILDTITFTSGNTWQLYILPLNAATGYNGTDDHVVLIHGGQQTFSDVYVDDFTYEPIPACPQLTNVSLSSVGITTATFSYNSGGNGVQYEWGPIGFTQGTGTTGTMTSGTGTITGLSSASCYDVYLRTDCTAGGNGYSIWTGPYTVCTLCTTQSLPYSENFDIGLGCFVVTDGGTTTDTWIHGTSSTTTTTTTGTALDASAGWVEADSDHAGPGAITMDEELTSAYIDASNLTGTLYLEFDQYYNHLSSNAEVEVWNGTTWINILTQSTSNVGAFGNPDHQKIDITQYANDSLQVRFVYKDNGAWAWWWVIDNVLIQEELCARSTNFRAAFVTADSIGLAWDPGSGANFLIEYGTSGFTQGAGTTVSTTDSSITITGLTSQTTYDFYLQDSCSSGTISLPVFLSVGTSCAITAPAVLPLVEDFETYTAGPTFTSPDYLCNPSYYWALNTGPNGRFRLQAGTNYYRGGAQAVTMDRATFQSTQETNELIMTVNLSNYTSSNGIELSFYWQRHTTTSRPDNKVYARGSVSDPWVELASLNNTFSGSFDSIKGLDIVAPLSIAGQTVSASTQIRWTEVGNSTSGFSNTCCDGYTIDDVRLEAVTCPLPGQLNVSNVFDTTATLNWAGSSSASNFQYWFGPAGFYQGTTTTAGVKAFANSGVVVDTLSPFTCYEFLVRAACSATDTSAWVGPFSFCTPCSPISAPYFEDWDALTAGKDLGCFSSIEDPSLQTSTFSGVLINSSTFANPYSAPNQVELDNSSLTTAPLMLVSPPTTDMTAGDKRLQIRARASFAGTPPSDIIVGTMSDGTDASTFNALDTIVLAATTPMDNYIVNLTTANGYNGTDQFFAIAHGNAAWFRTIYVDDLTYEVIPTCPEPSNLEVLSVDSLSAEVTFDPFSGSTGNFQIEVGTGTFGSASHSRLVVSNDTATIPGLMSGTNYCYWVREICTVGDTSNWVGPVCFKTECQTIFAPYFDNFDGLTAPGKDLGCFSSYEDASFATSNFQGVTVQNSTFNQPNSAPNVIELDNGFVSTNDLLFISPRTRDLDASDKRIRFYARASSTFNPGSVYVGTMSNPLDTGTFNVLDTIALGGGAMMEYTVEFNAANGYNGTDEFFVIGHALAGTFQTIYIDDVNYEAIPTCVRPDSLDATSITDSSASLSWGNPAAGGTFEIEYGVNPFGDPNNSRVSQGGNNLNLTGLSAGTGYCFWVRKICTPGDTSLWRGPFCFSTLCASSNPAPYFTNFNGITIGLAAGTPAGWENCWTTNVTGFQTRWESEDASGFNENSFGTGPLYDATTPTIAGGVYMYLETSTTNVGPAELISPPIDISTITNPEVEFWYHMHGATINKLVLLAEDATGTRTILDSLVGQQQPVQADPFLQRNVSLSGLTPGTYTFVFEGYRGTSFTGDIAIDDFRVQTGASCPRPTFVNQSAKNLTTIDVAWTANGTGTSWEIEYGPVGFTPGTGTAVIVTTNPYTITGLTSATNYDVYVSEICSAGDTSTQTGPVVMSTDICMASAKCQFNFDLKDTFGDGWNGAEITIYQNGIEVGKMGSNFVTGSLFNDSIDLCDTYQTDVVLTTPGGWASEIGLEVFDPTGASVANYVANFATAQGDTLASFVASCAGAPAPCPAPDSVWATSNVGCDSIEVDWNSNTGGSLIEWGAAGFTPGSGTMTAVVTAPYVISGLMPGTAYDIYVADTCSNDTSSYTMLASTTASGPLPVASFTIDSAIINNSSYEVYVDASASTNATSYSWDFGNGAVSSNAIDTTVYTGNGQYTITLIVTNGCGSDTATFTTNVNIGLEDNPISRSLSVYPNPASYSINVSFDAVGTGDAIIRLLDVQGRMIMSSEERANGSKFDHKFDVSNLATGIYMIEVQSGDMIARRRVSVK